MIPKVVLISLKRLFYLMNLKFIRTKITVILTITITSKN